MQSEGLSHRGKVNLFGPFARVQLQFVIENCVLEQYYKTALTHQGIDTAIQCTVLSGMGTFAVCPSGCGIRIALVSPRMLNPIRAMRRRGQILHKN